ncbi:MAG: ribosome maturation factor [Bacteroidetes bacterium]|nr:ribosome maturation factor [Bacteroidota bacterium]
MSTSSIIDNLEQLVNHYLGSEPEYFLIEIKIKPTNNIKVYIDGDKGISIEKCVQINRHLYKLLEEGKYFPQGDFSLEISSPGIDKPLKLHRQYIKNRGRKIEILFNDGSIKSGKLLQVSADDILIEEKSGKGKKTEIKQIVIPFSNIKSTTVQTEF